MKHVKAIFKKQWIETKRNKEMVLPFLVFPIITLIMTQSIHIDGMEPNFFVHLFSIMYITLPPINAMSSILSEEKAKHTLKVLTMANIKPWEYLFAIAGQVWLICMFGTILFTLMGSFTFWESMIFIIIMQIGSMISLMIGMIIGTWSKNQMTANALTIPVAMLFSFLPMLSMFNETIAKIARYTYSQSISLILTNIEHVSFDCLSMAVIAITFLCAICLFAYIYRKSPLLA